MQGENGRFEAEHSSSGKNETTASPAAGGGAKEGCCVCYSEECLSKWASGTDYWSQQNGQVVALTMWDDLNADWSSV